MEHVNLHMHIYYRLITQNEVHVLCCSVNPVQRVDAGEYRCRLSINTKVVESQSIILEVEGELQLCQDWIIFLLQTHTMDYQRLSFCLKDYQHLSGSQRTRT